MNAQSQNYDGPVLECRDLCISYFTRAGEIACVRIGRAVRYAPDDLKAWIKKRKTT